MCNVKTNLLPPENPSNRITLPLLAALHTRAGASSNGATMIPQDLTGRKFGRLNVLKFSRNDPKIGNFWLCACECGNHCEKTTGKLNGGKGVISCGCARRESIAKASAAAWAVTTKYFHPHKKKIKDMRKNMISRCYDSGCRSYKTYGARGITVCAEWVESYEVFYNWALTNGWRAGLTIERKNVNLGYSPENCCFIPASEQQSNTTRSHFLEWRGERLTISQWERKLKVGRGAIQHRVDRGWTLDEIFTQPFKSQK